MKGEEEKEIKTSKVDSLCFNFSEILSFEEMTVSIYAPMRTPAIEKKVNGGK